MMDAPKRVGIPMWVNSLRMFEWDEVPGLDLPEHPTYERLVQFLCTPDMDWKVPAVRERYRELGSEPTILAMAIMEPDLRDNIFWPVRHAKASYLTGNYLGTIALCGLVAEKLSILLFELHERDEIKRKAFTAWGQKQRIKRLKKLGLLKEEAIGDLEVIRDARIRHLHFWTPAGTGVENDAITSYRAATRLVVSMLDLRFGGGELAGTIQMDPRLLDYLRERGVVDERLSDS